MEYLIIEDNNGFVLHKPNCLVDIDKRMTTSTIVDPCMCTLNLVALGSV